MRKYIAHMQTKSPHERRQTAMQISGAITALLLFVWVSSFGVRLAQNNSQIANSANNISNAAATLMAVQQASTTLGY